MRLLLVGAPGSGKGTQAERLAARFGLEHLSSGDLLRKHVREDTSLGRAVKEYVARGDLVPDSVVMDMLRKPVVAAAAKGGYILDGFPRTLLQAQAAYVVSRELGVEVQAVMHLDVPQEELIRRLLARGRGSEDTAEIIEHRLEVYAQQTVPLVDYYARREWLIVVDGAQPPDDVTEDIARRLSLIYRPEGQQS